MDPLLGVGVEFAGGGGPDGGGEGGGGGEQGLFDGGAARGVPDAAEVLFGAGAAGLLEGEGAGVEAEAEAEEEHGEGGGGEPAVALGGVAGEGGEQGLHVGEAVFGGVLEAAEDELAEPAGGVAGGDGDGCADEDGEALLVEVGAGEGADAVEGLEEGDAEAELVAAGVAGGAEELFGGHVRGGADEGADGGGEGVVAGAVGRVAVARVVGAGEAEVEDADAAVLADEDVVGFEVAMDDADGVGGGEALAGGGEDLEDLAPGAALVGEPGAQGLAGDQLHGDEELVVDAADLVDLDDVGVGEAGEGLGLALEAGLADAEAVVVDAGAQELEGDAAVELGVVGGVDDGHAAVAEGAGDDVAADLTGAVGTRGAAIGRRGVAEGQRVRIGGVGVRHGRPAPSQLATISRSRGRAQPVRAGGACFVRSRAREERGPGWGLAAVRASLRGEVVTGRT